MAVLNLALGGTPAFVLIQEQLASLLSDTFFVPGYFHFLTVGTVTLTPAGGIDAPGSWADRARALDAAAVVGAALRRNGRAN